MGEAADSEDLNLVPIDTVDELTLSGVMFPSSSEGDSNKKEILVNLRKVRQDYWQGFESLYS